LHASPADVAEDFQRRVLPLLQQRLTQKGKLAVLGSSLIRQESTGTLRNRSSIG